MDKYDFNYKNVLCTEVDWEKDIFKFEYNGLKFSYTPSRRISQSSDLDHISVAINMFLEEMNAKPVNILLALKTMVESKMEDLEEAMGECGDEDGEFFEGQYRAWDEMLTLLDKFTTETV